MCKNSEKICSLCGYTGDFIRFHPDSSLRETRCPHCGSSRRNRDVARVLLRAVNLPDHVPLCERINELRHLRIYELQAAGPLHALLKELPLYQCSEFFPSIPPGERNDAGILCQDATRLTFESGMFDVVISQDILEHIDDAWRAFVEINRVLAQGGSHIFTVPIVEGIPTRKRAQQLADGSVRHLLPPVYHGDPLNPAGALVWWDYGDDFVSRLQEVGLVATIASQTRFYSPDEIPKIETQAAHARYAELRAQKQLSRFFLYNATVFEVKKS